MRQVVNREGITPSWRLLVAVVVLLSTAGCSHPSDLSGIAGEWKRANGETISITPKTYDLADVKMIDQGGDWWIFDIHRPVARSGKVVDWKARMKVTRESRDVIVANGEKLTAKS